MTGLTRRRFLLISASAAASGAFFSGAGAEIPSPAWRGVALGARADIRFDGLPRRQAARMVELCRAEIDRLENLFSLYRPDSALSRLNRTGRLSEPAPDFLEILSLSRTVYQATAGAFDPTVQSRWQTLAEHYSRAQGGDPAPAPGPLGFQTVRFNGERVMSEAPLTFNGIAQGFITDRIADLLKGHGLRHALVDIGEIRSLGPRAGGWDWPVRIVSAPGSQMRPDRHITLAGDRALATSDTLGTTFDRQARIGHIIEPESGTPARQRIVRTVEAPRAAIADALSTAFCLMDAPSIAAALDRFPATRLV